MTTDPGPAVRALGRLARITDARMTATRRLLILAVHVDGGRTAEELGRVADVTPRHAQRVLDELAAEGWISTIEEHPLGSDARFTGLVRYFAGHDDR